MPLRALLAVMALSFSPSVLRADIAVAPASWALNFDFPAAPQADEQRIPSPRGDEVAERRHLEHEGTRLMLTRLSYPVAPIPSERGSLYRDVIEQFMRSRRGVIHEDGRWACGEYAGQRLLIEQPADGTHREVRLVLIGDTLFFASAEWPGGRSPSAVASAFLSTLAPRPEFADMRRVEHQARWRELSSGAFSMRYDATRWYRDPEPAEAGTVVLLRVDGQAEAEFVTGQALPARTMEEVVIAHAREHADRVLVRRRGKRLQGTRTVEELRFTLRSEGVIFENHGYFYNGPEGSVQLRAWAPEATFAKVEGDIEELLEGLHIRASGAMSGASR